MIYCKPITRLRSEQISWSSNATIENHPASNEFHWNFDLPAAKCNGDAFLFRALKSHLQLNTLSRFQIKCLIRFKWNKPKSRHIILKCLCQCVVLLHCKWQSVDMFIWFSLVVFFSILTIEAVASQTADGWCLLNCF